MSIVGLLSSGASASASDAPRTLRVMSFNVTDNAPLESPASGQAGYFPNPDDQRYLRQWTGSKWGSHRYLKQDLPESALEPYDPLDSPGPPVPAEQVVPRIWPGGSTGRGSSGIG